MLLGHIYLGPGLLCKVTQLFVVFARLFGGFPRLIGSVFRALHALNGAFARRVGLDDKAVRLRLGFDAGVGHAVVGRNGGFGHGLPGSVDFARGGCAASLDYIKSLFAGARQLVKLGLGLDAQLAQRLAQALDAGYLVLDGGALLVQRRLHTRHAIGAHLARGAHGAQLLAHSIHSLQAVGLGDSGHKGHFNGPRRFLRAHTGGHGRFGHQAHVIDSLLRTRADFAQGLRGIHAQLVKAGGKYLLVRRSPLLGRDHPLACRLFQICAQCADLACIELA